MTDAATEQALGDPDQLRSAARSWGNEAATYNSQVTSLTRVQDALPHSAFTGAKGDQIRSWLTDTLRTTTALRGAYQQIGAAAPFLADAIEDAKQAKRRKDRAETDLDDARREASAAANAVNRAQRALTAAHQRDAARSAASGGTASGGESARAAEELAAAQRRLTRAEHDLDVKERAYRRASDDFDDAKAKRERVNRAFETLLREQTRIINQTLPSAPPAPSVAPVLSELKIVGRGRQALKGLIDLQEKAIRTHYGVPERLSLNELRRIRTESGQSLGKLLSLALKPKFGPLTESQSRALAQIEKWSGRVGKVNKTLSGGLTLASKTIEALNDPHLSSQQKQDQIVNRFLLEFGGGTLGAAACSEAGLVASAACGELGTRAGKVLESSSLARRATNGLSHTVVNPLVEVGGDVADGNALEAAKDYGLVPVRIPYNLITQTAPTPDRVAGVAKDAASDAKKVGDYLQKKQNDFFSNLARGLRGGY